jgi:hypothetical protein
MTLNFHIECNGVSEILTYDMGRRTGRAGKSGSLGGGSSSPFGAESEKSLEASWEEVLEISTDESDGGGSSSNSAGGGGRDKGGGRFSGTGGLEAALALAEEMSGGGLEVVERDALRNEATKEDWLFGLEATESSLGPVMTTAVDWDRAPLGVEESPW